MIYEMECSSHQAPSHNLHFDQLEIQTMNLITKSNISKYKVSGSLVQMAKLDVTGGIIALTYR